jgi:hypothetical protein
MEYERRIVAFIDILGWSKAVEESVKDARLRGRMENVVKALGTIVLDRVNEKDRPGSPLSDDQAAQFSDSIIISYLFDAPHHLTRLIQELGTYQSALLLERFPSRGGISAGPMYHKVRIAFGPALNSATALEREHAKAPRVIIEPTLNSEVEAAAKSFPRHWTFVRQDGDGYFFTDYLTPMAMSPTVREIVQSFINDRLSRFSGNEKLLPKYRWLSERFAEAVADSEWRREIHRDSS